MYNMLFVGFPSPCGVLVLKLSRDELSTLLEEGFRPLAGFWFLNLPPFSLKVYTSLVSVPLRGSGS